ncbi:MAG: L-rhamnose catabolism isomerase [bacterium]
MSRGFRIKEEFIQKQNQTQVADLKYDYEHLGNQLARRKINIEALIQKALHLQVALPSWGVGTGGTRFARFPGIGEPRDIFDKLVDCATVQQLVRMTPSVSLHIPWDKTDDLPALKAFAEHLGMGFDAMNSNTFQDQPGQELSYKFGSLTHTQKAVRQQAIQHNIECIEIGKELGSKALTVWIGDGGNFAGQQNFQNALNLYMESVREIYAALPKDWRLFIEHKLFEPAFYSTVLNDWGVSYWCVNELGPKAFSLVDLGHHAPTVNIEMVVSRLIQFGKLGGFHFNDSKYGDDDLDTGSLQPFQLFLIFNELVDAELRNLPDFDPAYMLDQSHNVSDPIESLMLSAIEVQRAYVQAHLVDRNALAAYQESNDAILSLQTLKHAFTTDVSPILAMARYRSGGAIDPVAAYRASEYREEKSKERPEAAAGSAGIV